jgi:hypothetical protein
MECAFCAIVAGDLPASVPRTALAPAAVKRTRSANR